MALRRSRRSEPAGRVPAAASAATEASGEDIETGGTPAPATPTTTRGERGDGIMWGGLLLLVALALAVVVAVQNTHDVAFEFLWIEASAPLVLVIALAVGVTILADQVVGFVWRHRRRVRRRERDELRRLRGRGGS